MSPQHANGRRPLASVALSPFTKAKRLARNIKISVEPEAPAQSEPLPPPFIPTSPPFLPPELIVEVVHFVHDGLYPGCTWCHYHALRSIALTSRLCYSAATDVLYNHINLNRSHELVDHLPRTGEDSSTLLSKYTTRGRFFSRRRRKQDHELLADWEKWLDRLSTCPLHRDVGMEFGTGDWRKKLQTKQVQKLSRTLSENPYLSMKVRTVRLYATELEESQKRNFIISYANIISHCPNLAEIKGLHVALRGLPNIHMPRVNGGWEYYILWRALASCKSLKSFGWSLWEREHLPPDLVNEKNEFMLTHNSWSNLRCLAFKNFHRKATPTSTYSKVFSLLPKLEELTIATSSIPAIMPAVPPNQLKSLFIYTYAGPLEYGPILDYLRKTPSVYETPKFETLNFYGGSNPDPFSTPLHVPEDEYYWFESFLMTLLECAPRTKEINLFLSPHGYSGWDVQTYNQGRVLGLLQDLWARGPVLDKVTLSVPYYGPNTIIQLERMKRRANEIKDDCSTEASICTSHFDPILDALCRKEGSIFTVVKLHGKKVWVTKPHEVCCGSWHTWLFPHLI